MKSIRPVVVGTVVPPIASLISVRPSSWLGMRIGWTSESAPVPVFLSRLHGADVVGAELYVFGARYELSDALIDGQSLGAGYFIEFFVVWEEAPGRWTVRRLLQHQSITFSETGESGDYIAAEDIRDQMLLCSRELPIWKTSEAVWPTCGDRPMKFVGQFSLPDTKVARDLFTWGENIYLFWAQTGSSVVFKIVEQEADFQTADEHYASES